jgi:hypothetical protein
MAKFKPTEADMRETVRALERAEKKWEPWQKEGDRYNGLYVNDVQSFNKDAPGGNQDIGRSETATVVRNGIAFAVRAAIRRKMIKNPRFSADPLVSMMNREMPDGTVMDIESSHAAYAQGEILTYTTRKKHLSESLIPVLEQGEIYGEGWLKCVTWNGADAPETMVWVDSESFEESEGSTRKIKSRRPLNSLANDRYPAAIFVSCEDVIPDADATNDAEINRITHRCVKPLSQMKTAEIDDYELKIDPKSGKLKAIPVIDPFTGETKKRKKYMNLDGLEGNYNQYLDRRLIGKRKDGDIRNESSFQTDSDPKDMLVFFEENGRFAADSEVVVKEFGAVPKTEDGFVYFWKVYVENTQAGSDNGPTLIRWDWYPVDLGGFALRRYRPFPKAGSLRSASWIRDAHEALALENYWESFDTAWYAVYKPVCVWNGRLVDKDLISKIQNGEHFDNIVADVPAGMNLRDARMVTEFQESPQGVQMLKARARMIQDEASGASANQRLQASGDISATQSGIIQENASDQTAFDVERVKAFVEDVGGVLMRLFRAAMPESGRYEIPGSDGAFVLFDAMQLDILCAFKLDYSSFNQQPNPVETKQLQELIGSIVQTPPQLWEKMMPMWEVQASRFTPAVYSAFRKFVKNAFTQKPDTDPNKEHLLMAAGVKVEPDPNENFIETYPQHQKMLQEVVNEKSPLFKTWNAETPTGLIPRQLLSYHLLKSKSMAIARGMGPALGLQADQSGMQRKERGSGPSSGRMSQAPPEAGAVESGANSVEMPTA